MATTNEDGSKDIDQHYHILAEGRYHLLCGPWEVNMDESIAKQDLFLFERGFGEWRYCGYAWRLIGRMH